MNIFYVVVAAVLSSAFFISCSQVEIEEFNSESSTKVKFSVNWKNVRSSDDNVPELLTVFMNRIQSITVRYVRTLDSDGNVVPEVVDDAVAENAGSLDFQNGYYQIAAVAAENPEDCEVPMTQMFKKDRDSTAISMKDVYVTVSHVSDSEKEELDYLDFNQSYPLIRSVKPIYLVKSTASGQLISPNNRHISAEDHRLEISLTPEIVTRNISFSVKFNVGEGVTVERIYGVISGVPQQIRLSSGVVSNLGTGKVYFPMEQLNSVEVGDRLYGGSVNTLGLFPSTDINFITGPGVLNVVVYACAEEAGVSFQRVYHASLNIKEEIEAAKIMLQVEGKTGYVIGGTEDVHIEVIRGLKLTHKMIVDGTGQGLVKWEDNAIGQPGQPDFEEGMFPEI